MNYSHLFFNKNNLIYLDSSTMPIKPKEIIKKLKKDIESFYYPPFKNIYYENLKNENDIENTKSKLAKYLNVSKDEIFFGFGATDCLKKIIYLINKKIHKNDEVLFSKDDHKNVVDLIEKINANKIEYQLFSHSGDCDWRDINNKINKKTKFIFVNHLHGVYGLEAETEKINKKNSFLILDLSQSISRIPCDLKFKQADIAFFSGYKLFGLEGVGICYISKNIQNYFSIEEINNIFNLKNISFLGIKSIFYGLEFIEKIGINNIRIYLTQLTQNLIYKLTKTINIKFLPGAYYTNCATGYGILSFSIDKIHFNEIIPYFEKNKIYVRGETSCYQTKNYHSNFLRVSMHINNNLDEVDYFVNVLKTIV